MASEASDAADDKPLTAYERKWLRRLIAWYMNQQGLVAMVEMGSGEVFGEMEDATYAALVKATGEGQTVNELLAKLLWDAVERRKDDDS